MSISTNVPDERVADVKLTSNTLVVSLKDGRIISVPLTWYPRLLSASKAQRKNWQISGGGYGIHWPDIDEDLSTEGLLRGAPAAGRSLIVNDNEKRRSRVVNLINRNEEIASHHSSNEAGFSPEVERLISNCIARRTELGLGRLARHDAIEFLIRSSTNFLEATNFLTREDIDVDGEGNPRIRKKVRKEEEIEGEEVQKETA